MRLCAVLGLAFLALPGRATLLIGIPSRPGIVICSDRRADIGVAGTKYSDTWRKVLQLNKWAACGSTGQLHFVNQATGVVAFDANAEAKAYFSSKSIEIVDWEHYGNAVQHALISKVLALTRDLPHPYADGVIFQTVFFFLDEQKIVEIVRNRFYLTITGNQGTTSSDTIRIENDLLNRAYPERFGHVEVCDEIEKGHRPQFDDIRKDTEIQRLLITKPEAADVSEDEALRVARKLIRVTAERLSWLHERNDVSPTCDCAVINRVDGFRWVTERQSPRKSQSGRR